MNGFLDDGDANRHTLDLVADGIVSLDGDLRYTYMNTRAEEILGKTEAELLGEHIWDVFDEGTRAAVEDWFAPVLNSGQSVSYERYNEELGQWLDVRIVPDEGGVTIVFTDVTRARESVRNLDRILETAPVGITILDSDGTITRANARAERLLGLERTTIEGRAYDHPEWEIWDENREPIAVEEHPVGTVLETGEPVRGFVHGITLPGGTEYWLSSNSAPIRDGSGSVEQVVVAVEDVTALKRLERLIETLQPVDEALTRASTRRDTEAEICDLLIASDQYELAWIADYVPGTTQLLPHYRAGPEETYLDDIEIPLTEESPSRQAVETGSVQAIRNVDEDPYFTPWRERAAEHGLSGAAAVPLIYSGHVHGVLGLYTARSGAFDEREQRLLGTLGRRVGQVIHALETESLLHSDSVVELGFRSTDPGSFLIAASAELGCEMTVANTIPIDEEAMLYYIEVENADLGAVEDLAESVPEIDKIRRIEESEATTGGVLELVMRRRSLAHVLVSAGGVVTTDRAVEGAADVICECARDRDTADIVSRVTAAFPDTELVSKREVDRPTETTRIGPISRLAEIFETELTDRQRQTLRAAFHAGYFESPRRSSGSDIAAALSMTQPTFSHHLRNAQQTLFEHLLSQV